MNEVISSNRVRAARVVAIIADLLQLFSLPIFLPLGYALDDVIDVAAAIILTWLVGWHWEFVPSFLMKIVPFVDFTPTWTLAVLWATRSKPPDATAVSIVQPPPVVRPMLVEQNPARNFRT